MTARGGKGQVRPGRPKVPIISRRDAVAAALEIIDSQGLDKLSIRALGARVGVNGMSLYNHFRDKDDILDQVAGLIVERIGVPPAPVQDVPSVDEFTEWSLTSAIMYRGALLEHPNAIPLFVTGYPQRGRHAVFAGEFEAFAAVGIDRRYWLAIVYALESLVVGSTLFLSGNRAQVDEDGADPTIDADVRAAAIPDDDAFANAYRALVRSLIERYRELSE